MALPPTIPTSFVPKQPVHTDARRARGGTNIFFILSLIVLAIALFAAVGTFGYEKYLESVRNSKTAKLVQAQKNLDPDRVEQFIRLRDRLIAAKTLTDQHIALSQFFDALESVTLQNVRFDALHITVEDDRSAQITMSGVARSFNALAAESTAFAGESRIKSAIFSGITVGKDGTVNFSLKAELDPRLVVRTTTPEKSAVAAKPALVATSTMPALPATTASTTPKTP